MRRYPGYGRYKRYRWTNSGTNTGCFPFILLYFGTPIVFLFLVSATNGSPLTFVGVILWVVWIFRKF
jgi:hypothetical protein